MSTIKYPNGISTINTMQSKSYSSRGMRLENDINDSNKYYRELDKALIYKKPTPVQVVHVDYPKRQRAKITEAYYKTPSTTDYNGVYRGKYIDFEAKIMALSESLLLLTGICFWKNTYVFSKKVVHVFLKTRTCFFKA
mgnify:CR=1 FL=1